MVDQLEKQRFSTVGDLILAQGGPIFTPCIPRFDLPQVMRHALKNQSALEIVYAGTGASRTRRVITPLYPAKHSGTTYIIAYCHLRKGPENVSPGSYARDRKNQLSGCAKASLIAKETQF